MQFHDLADDGANKAWARFLELEEEWRKNPSNKEKYQKSRRAFREYDDLRVKFYSLPTED